MAEDKKTLAKKVYQTVCSALEERNWTYKKDEEKRAVFFGVTGEDLPMDIVMSVDEDRQLLRIFSPMPYNIPEDKRIDLAVAVCHAAFGMADGGFDYDIAKGSIHFRAAAAFHGSDIGTGLVQYLISLTCAMVDKYNDQFLMVSKGTLSLQDFLSLE